VPPRSPLQGPPKVNEDAFLALTTVGPWVNNADTKIGLLATALTILTTGVVRQRPRVETLLHRGVHPRGTLSLASLTVCTLMVMLAGYWLFRAFSPRLENPEPSRFAFPHLAEVDLATLVDADAAVIRAEAWIQVRTLSRIVLRKYTFFKKALGAGFGAGVAFIGWLLLVPA